MFHGYPKKIRKSLFRHRIEYVMFKQKRHEYLRRKRIIERQKNDAINHTKALMNHEDAIQHQDENRPR